MSPPFFVVERDLIRDVDTVCLDGAEGRHAASVRRLRPGERVVLTDGQGLRADCCVTAAGRAQLELAVESRHQVPPPQPRFVVVQALPKGDRAELAVELMTEVGADVVVPWAAHRCVTRWNDARAERGVSRWRATAREAAKQARREWVPEVLAAHSTDEVARLVGSAASAVVLDEDADAPLAAVGVLAEGDVVLVVGPEGGITLEELAAFETAGAVATRLGPTVLRTSTAAAAALSVLLARTPRWGSATATPP